MRDEKEKKKQRRGEDVRIETVQEELERVREACALLRGILREFPAVRRDLRALLWSLDDGKGVDLASLAGTCRHCFTGEHALTQLIIVVAGLRERLKLFFTALQLQRSAGEVWTRRPGAPLILRSIVGAVFDEPVTAAQPSSKSLVAEKRPCPLPMTKTPSAEDSSVTHAATPVPVDVGPRVPIGPTLPTVHARVLGPAPPPPELLAESASIFGAFGPAPLEILTEASKQDAPSRDAAVARVLDALSSGSDAFALLGCDVGCDEGTLRRAFWRASLSVHPDKCAHPRAAEAFAALTAARDELSDPVKRSAIEAHRAEATERAAFAAQRAATAQAARWRRARGFAPLPGDDEAIGDGIVSGRADWMLSIPAAVPAGPAQVNVTSFSSRDRGIVDHSWTHMPGQEVSTLQSLTAHGDVATLARKFMYTRPSLMSQHQQRASAAPRASPPKPAKAHIAETLTGRFSKST